MKKWMRKIKAWVRNTILIGISILAIFTLFMSMRVLMLQAYKALLVFILSVAWLVLFAHANR